MRTWLTPRYLLCMERFDILSFSLELFVHNRSLYFPIRCKMVEHFMADCNGRKSLNLELKLSCTNTKFYRSIELHVCKHKHIEYSCSWKFVRRPLRISSAEYLKFKSLLHFIQFTFWNWNVHNDKNKIHG